MKTKKGKAKPKADTIAVKEFVVDTKEPDGTDDTDELVDFLCQLTKRLED